MPSYIVSRNCEYSILIDDAASPEKAMEIAEKIPDEEWNQAWSEFDAEEQ